MEISWNFVSLKKWEPWIYISPNVDIEISSVIWGEDAMDTFLLRDSFFHDFMGFLGFFAKYRVDTPSPRRSELIWSTTVLSNKCRFSLSCRDSNKP